MHRTAGIVIRRLALGAFWLALAGVLWRAASQPQHPAGSTEQPLPAGVAVIPWGHHEATLMGTKLVPRWIGSKLKIGGCLDVPLDLDTSQWRAQVRLGDGDSQPSSPFDPPLFEAGNNLCFGRLPPASWRDSPGGPREIEVCLVVRDEFEPEVSYRAPCYTATYETSNAEYTALLERLRPMADNHDRLARDQLLTTFDEIAAQAAAAGFPFLALHARLIVIDRLRAEGDAEALALAESWLADLPTWLGEPETTALAITATLARAQVAHAKGQLLDSWRYLSQADELARHYVSARRLAVAMEQASILTLLGQREEPLRRLTAALDGCSRRRCDQRLIPSAHTLHAWLLLIDPDAQPEALEQARNSLDQALAPTAGGQDIAELANLQINRALLASRLGADPSPWLDRARQQLQTLPPTPRREALLTWARVVEGLQALSHADAAQALRSCSVGEDSAAQPRIVSWLWSCRGRAYRQLGKLALAGDAFARAIHHGVHAQTATLGQVLPLAPGRLADDFFRAARVAVEKNDPAAAWELLASLDRIAARNGCEPQAPLHRVELENRQDLLRLQLDATAPPLAPARARQMAPRRQELLTSLEEVQRSLNARCAAAVELGHPADLRAFALDDEIVLLARDAHGEVRLARRTALPRAELLQLLERLDQAQKEIPDDTTWRRLAEPLAQALIPPAEVQLGAVTHYALHGALQRVPLSALPLGQDGWLSTRTVPVWRPSFVERTATSDPGQPSTTSPLFVVDPRLDLPSGATAKEDYRRRFPSARVLYGAAATQAALQEATREASFIHIDAHGRHDPAFSQLSGLLMHDGLITLADIPIPAFPPAFVNLSSCDIGGDRPSADSGRFGFAGALARRGIPWVIASSSTLDDRLAYEFNAAFYDAIQRELTVPQAFVAALGALRQRYPAAAWTRLRLIGGKAGGKTGTEATIWYLREEGKDAT